jgi:hypothetical protein
VADGRLAPLWLAHANASQPLSEEEMEQVMNESRLIGHALRLMTTVILAGCSAGANFNPSAPITPQIDAGAQTQTLHDATGRGRDAVKPNEADPCNGQSPFTYYGPATWWNESFSPTVWTEFSGYYTEANTNNGILWQPCPGATVMQTCSPSPTCPGTTNNYHTQIDAMKANTSRCKACFVVAEAASSQIALVTAAKKGVLTQVGVLSATIGSTAYAPIGVAVAENGSIYASSLSVVGSGFGNSAVLVYSPGASAPSSILSDPGLGQAAGSIAADEKGDVFLSYTTNSGSKISAQIDEFRKGSSKPVPFATIGNAYNGALAVTKKGDVVASSISLYGSGGGQAAEFSPTGKRMAAFTVAGLPTAISLDSSNKHLWVDDATNDAISEYAFPAGGEPIVSAPLETPYGQPLIPADFLGNAQRR